MSPHLGHDKGPDYPGSKAGPNCLGPDVIIPAQLVLHDPLLLGLDETFYLIFIIIKSITIKNSIICGINILIFIIIKNINSKIV